MDSGRLKLLVHTLKYLRFKQIYYRLYYFVRNRFFKRSYDIPLSSSATTLIWEDSFFYRKSFYGNAKFEFLNIHHVFKNEIDWNLSDYGKLWTYNLNYFDFLNQKDLSKESGLLLIRDFMRQNEVLKDAKEPYPISLRGINWVKFLSKHKIQDTEIEQVLFNDYNRLFHNLEYHLLGNHLLENGFALFFGAYYFQNEKFYLKSKQILNQELKEQILSDGAHFELSPMYHQILLHRVLDCINLATHNTWKKDTLEATLIHTAQRMLSWLEKVTFSNGNVPMVNDSAYGIAPSSKELFDYAKKLELTKKPLRLSDSGYRKFNGKRYELLVDVGDVGPKYQPGHAHADTFSFELYIDGRPIIVDTGISTYEKNELRQLQRGTSAHNTVKVADKDQSQVWGGFRVAKRAVVSDLVEDDNQVEATHNGYKNLGIFHTRKFHVLDSEIEIIDELTNKNTSKQKAFFHFHPKASDFKIITEQKTITLDNRNIKINFEGNILNLESEEYQYATGFNRTQTAKRLAVSFYTSIRTQIIFPEFAMNSRRIQ